MTTLVGQGPPFATEAYQYITEADEIPPIDETPDWPIARVKLFNPNGAGTWYIAGFDPETGQAFGVAEILETELGYFDLGELVAYRGRFGLPLERDLYWKPTPTSELVKGGAT